VLVVTTEQLPGYEIRQILGEVVSSMARTRNPYREGVKNLRGGAYDPLAPDNLTRWRTDSVARLGEEARRIGANAVIGMRFDSRDCGEMWMEICAYGTAVVVVPDAGRHAARPAGDRGGDRPPVGGSGGPGGIAEPASAPNLSSAAETPHPRLLTDLPPLIMKLLPRHAGRGDNNFLINRDWGGSRMGGGV
jgi:uncharacterized protein YbjQ (UPF0145 family)